MFRQMQKPQNKVRRKRKGSPDEMSEHPRVHAPVNELSPDSILQLQQTHGNAYVQRMLENGQDTELAPPKSLLIQRLPTDVEVQDEGGRAKKRMESYGNVLTDLRSYHSFIRAAQVNVSEPLQRQYDTILEFLDRIYSSASTYVDKKEGKRFSNKKRIAAMKKLMSQVMRERVIVGAVYDLYLRKPKSVKNPVWKMAIADATTNDAWRDYATQFGDQDVTGSAKGGSHEVKKVTPGSGGPSGFFQGEDNLSINVQALLIEASEVADEVYTKALKEGKITDDALNLSARAKAKKIQQLVQGTPLEDKSFNVDSMSDQEVREWVQTFSNSMNNIDAMRTGAAGIGSTPDTMFGTDDTLKLPERNVASTRLDRLLGAGMLARAEKAVTESGEKGSLMEMAQGTQMSSLDKSQAEQIMNDPGVMRGLSRLQLLDTIAMQVDRNYSNFFVLKDKKGKVVKITGIDNDMSWGKHTDINISSESYPGLSRFVDKELAEAIINLSPDDLEWILRDLISSSEVGAAKTRLLTLQTNLKSLKDNKQLLEPHQWDEAVKNGLLKERKGGGGNYFDDISFKISRL